MNQNIIIFKYSLIAFNEYFNLIKNQKLKLNETEFFNIFQSAIKQNYLFINSKIPIDDLCYLILQYSRSLCELEALTFMPDENIPNYNKTKQNISHAIKNLIKVLNENNYNFIDRYTQCDWRIFLSILDTFKEWAEEIKYFENNELEKINILKESPLISLCHL